jgi:hypothetical protein
LNSARGAHLNLLADATFARGTLHSARAFRLSEEDYAMRLRTALVAALLLAPTAALAAPGIVTVSTGLRAGPGAGFPLVAYVAMPGAT